MKPSIKFPLAAATIAGTILALTACGTGVSAGTPAADDGESFTIANCGRDVRIEGTPKAAVGLSPSQTEMLLRLGLADSVVAQAQVESAPLHSDVASLATDILVLGGQTPPSREELLQAAPDFVFAPTTYEFTAEQGFASLEQLEQAGVAAYVATGGCFDRRMTGTVDDVFTDLDNIGRIFSVQSEADALIAQGREDLDTVSTTIDGRAKPTVAQVYYEGDTLSAIGAGIEYDIIKLAGGDNVFSPDDAAFADFFAAQISPETLAAENPEAIVFGVRGPEQKQATIDYLSTTFPDLAAVKNNRLIAISAADTMPGTLGNISVVREIAEQLHTGAFSS